MWFKFAPGMWICSHAWWNQGAFNQLFRIVVVICSIPWHSNLNFIFGKTMNYVSPKHCLYEGHFRGGYILVVGSQKRFQKLHSLSHSFAVDNARRYFKLIMEASHNFSNLTSYLFSDSSSEETADQKKLPLAYIRRNWWQQPNGLYRCAKFELIWSGKHWTLPVQ